MIERKPLKKEYVAAGLFVFAVLCCLIAAAC